MAEYSAEWQFEGVEWSRLGENGNQRGCRTPNFLAFHFFGRRIPAYDDHDPSVLATWLMMRWMRSTRTWMRRATSGRNSVMKLSMGAEARPMP